MIPSLDVLDAVFDDLVEKGDYVGHPFRGNQWTDASGVSQGGAGSDVRADLGPLHLRGVATVEEAIAQGRPLAMLRPETYSPKVRELVDANTKARDLLGQMMTEAEADGTSILSDPRFAVLETILVLTAVEAGRQIALEYALSLGFETVADPPRSSYGTIISEEFAYEDHSRNEDGRLVRSEESIDANAAVNLNRILNSVTLPTVILEKSDDGELTVRFAKYESVSAGATRSGYEYGDTVDAATLLGAKFFRETADEAGTPARDMDTFTLARGEQAGAMGRELVRQAAQDLGITMPAFRPPVHVTAAPLAEKLRAQGEYDVADKIGTMLEHVQDVARGFTMYGTALSTEAAGRRTDGDNMKPVMLAEQAADLPPTTKVSVTVPANRMAAILKDGRLKNQFETGTSKGLNLPRVRESAEALQFGLPQGTNPATRPIYGMMESGGVVVPSSARGNEQYGTVTLVLKDAVRDRTTFTKEDSLNRQGDPVPAEDAGRTLSARDPDSKAEFDRKAALRAERPTRTAGYYEAQIHGGVATSDIEKVIIDTSTYKDFEWTTVQPSPSLIKALNRAGIPFEIISGKAVDKAVRKFAKLRFRMTAMLKGDFVGHPFRGNQWTDASGASQTGTSATPAGTPTKQLLTGVREYRLHLAEFDKDRWAPTLFVDGQPTTIQGTVSHFTKEKAEKGLRKFERETEAMLGAAVKVADADGGQVPLAELTFTNAAGRVATKRVGWAEQGRVEALEAYTRDSVALNVALRSGASTDGPLDAFMESGLQETVYRSIANTNGVAGRLFSELMDGGTVVDRGYSSTSRNASQAAEMDVMGDGLILQIQLPSGASRLAVPKGVFFGGDQEEVILPRGAGFRLVREGKSVDGRPTLVVEMVEGAETVEKGDFVGHPFRGNQWMGADGVGRMGAESSPDQDRRAYEMRQEGKTWEEIAKELGYANGGAVRRLAIRHEARLKEGTEVKPPIPDVPQPEPTEEKGGQISSLADPTSVRSARRLLNKIFEAQGVVATISAAVGNRSEASLSPEEQELLGQILQVGTLLDKAIQSEIALAQGAGTDAVAIAEAQQEMATVVERLLSVSSAVEDDLNAAIGKALRGTSQQPRGQTSAVLGVRTVLGAIAEAERLLQQEIGEYTRQGDYLPLDFKKANPVVDDSTIVGRLQAAGGTVRDAGEPAPDDATPEQVQLAQAVYRAQTQTQNELRRGYLKVVGTLTPEVLSGVGGGYDAPLDKRLVSHDALQVRSDAANAVDKIVRDVQSGKLTVEQAIALSDAEIVDKTTVTWQRGFVNGEQYREDQYRGTVQVLERKGEKVNEAPTRVDDPKFAVLNADLRQKLLVSNVREALRDPTVRRNLELAGQIRTRENLTFMGRTLPAGASVDEVKSFSQSFTAETNADTAGLLQERQTAVKRVLEAAGVKFARVKDVTVTVVHEGRGKQNPQTTALYEKAIASVIPFLPRALVDGSMSQSVIGRFSGGGPLKILAVSGSGVRRAHAENRGSGAVTIRHQKPVLNKKGELSNHDRSVFLHEIGHGLEYANPWIRTVEAQTWIDRRGTEPIRTLNAIVGGGGGGYNSNEKGVKDEWRNVYAGKTYTQAAFRSSAYEILTTGLQNLWFGDQAADDAHRAVVLGILAATGAKP